MELTNEFTVPVPVERAWEVLNDVELIAPCLPGAQLQEIEDDEYRGTVKVKVGPITAQYKGAATFQEQDEANRKIVLKAEGRDTRGQGSASAIITATMNETDGSTHVKVDSDVTIKGKVAQFGRGMIAEVSSNLLTQFVECLETKLEGEPEASSPGSDDTPETVGDPAAEAARSDSSSPGVRKVESAEAAPVNLLDSAGAPVAKRAAPIAILVIVLLLLGWRRAARRRS
ncbi:MAG: SRPBCC family protein [Acidimicrobiales bacterium]|nr:SRPBCC family protein [Acidimicrobiales bacterium]